MEAARSAGHGLLVGVSKRINVSTFKTAKNSGIKHFTLYFLVSNFDYLRDIRMSSLSREKRCWTPPEIEWRRSTPKRDREISSLKRETISQCGWRISYNKIKNQLNRGTKFYGVTIHVNHISAVISHGTICFECSIWVCGPSPMDWPFKWLPKPLQ